MLYEQAPHDLLPQATHDELARQNFVQSLKVHLATNDFSGEQSDIRKTRKAAFRTRTATRTAKST